MLTQAEVDALEDDTPIWVLWASLRHEVLYYIAVDVDGQRYASPDTSRVNPVRFYNHLRDVGFSQYRTRVWLKA